MNTVRGNHPASWRRNLGQTMQFGLLLVFTAIPFLEIALMIKVGQAIGFWYTLLLLVASAALGTYVIFQQGFQVLGRALDAINRGKPPVAPVIDGMFILFAGILLIVPGFLTDAAGLALLVPRVRHRFAVWCLRRLIRSEDLRGFVFGDRYQSARGGPTGGKTGTHDHSASQSGREPTGEGPIIEGEFQRLDERTVDRGSGRERTPPN